MSPISPRFLFFVLFTLFTLVASATAAVETRSGDNNGGGEDPPDRIPREAKGKGVNPVDKPPPKKPAKKAKEAPGDPDKAGPSKTPQPAGSSMGGTSRGTHDGRAQQDVRLPVLHMTSVLAADAVDAAHLLALSYLAVDHHFSPPNLDVTSLPPTTRPEIRTFMENAVIDPDDPDSDDNQEAFHELCRRLGQQVPAGFQPSSPLLVFLELGPAPAANSLEFLAWVTELHVRMVAFMRTVDSADNLKLEIVHALQEFDRANGLDRSRDRLYEGDAGNPRHYNAGPVPRGWTPAHAGDPVHQGAAPVGQGGPTNQAGHRPPPVGAQSDHAPVNPAVRHQCFLPPTGPSQDFLHLAMMLTLLFCFLSCWRSLGVGVTRVGVSTAIPS
jgi:hypothetical protein